MATFLLTSTLNDHEVCTILPPINSDEGDWRHVFVATCIQEDGATDDIAIEVQKNDKNDEGNENGSDVSQISPEKP